MVQLSNKGTSDHRLTLNIHLHTGNIEDDMSTAHSQEPHASPTLQAEPPAILLPHDSLNDKLKPTILLIHGMFSSKDTFKPLHPYLSEYHLLIPTLPGHQESPSNSDIAALTLENTSAQLSALVSAKAPAGRVHLVGHSFGANIALHYASHHPDQIISVLVSGTAGFIASKATPYALWLEGLITYAAPSRLIEYLLDVDPELRGAEGFGGVRNMALCRTLCGITAIPVDSEELVPAGAKGEFEARNVRVLALAATKKGFLPTNDNLERAKLVVKRLGGTVVEVPSMRHGWYLQDPQLFVNVVVAWIQGRDLPGPVITHI